MPDCLYDIQIIISEIFKDSTRDNPKVFQKYLCVLIFPRWDDFCAYYQLTFNKKYESIEQFFSVLFEIDCKIVQSILMQLDLYKNYKISEKDAMQACCSVKLHIESHSQ